MGVSMTTQMTTNARPGDKFVVTGAGPIQELGYGHAFGRRCHEQAVLDACNIVRKQGEVVLVGVLWSARTSILAYEVRKAVFFNYVVLRSLEWPLPLHARGFVWKELYEGYNNASQSNCSGFEKALGWLAAGRIPLYGLVRTRSPREPEPLYASRARGEFADTFTVLDWS
jgi:threonine dehydrogenase-like Zn-dependent dehydrogenase